jgi:hypothetical protein
MVRINANLVENDKKYDTFSGGILTTIMADVQKSGDHFWRQNFATFTHH